MNVKELLRSIMNQHCSIQNEKDKWLGSTFEQLKKMPTTSKGTVIEDFVYEMLCQSNFGTIEKNSKKGEWDVKMDNKTIEVKLATEDTSECFQFNGIRYHRSYDFVLVVGVSPEDIYFNFYKASDIKAGHIGKLVGMEKGAVGSNKLTRKKNQMKLLNSLQTFKTHIETKTQ